MVSHCGGGCWDRVVSLIWWSTTQAHMAASVLFSLPRSRQRGNAIFCRGPSRCRCSFAGCDICCFSWSPTAGDVGRLWFAMGQLEGSDGRTQWRGYQANRNPENLLRASASNECAQRYRKFEHEKFGGGDRRSGLKRATEAEGREQITQKIHTLILKVRA